MIRSRSKQNNPIGAMAMGSKKKSQSMAKKKSQSSSRPSKRPLTVYNLFYRYKRTVLMQACNENIDRGEVCRLIKIAPGLENYPPELQNKIPKDHLDGGRRTAIRRKLEHQLTPRSITKRKHRKGQNGFNVNVSFLEMSRYISDAWKALDDFSKSVFKELAEDGKRESMRLLVEYNNNIRTSARAKKMTTATPIEPPKSAVSSQETFESIASCKSNNIKDSLIDFDCDMDPLPFDPSQFWDENSLPSICEDEMPLLIEYDENVSPAGVFKAKRRHSLDTLADWETEKNEAGSSPTVVSDHSSDSDETLTSNKRLKEKKKGLAVKEAPVVDAKLIEKNRLKEYQLAQWKRTQALRAVNGADTKKPKRKGPRKFFATHGDVKKTVSVPKMPTEAEKDGSNTIENLVSLMAQETEKQLDSYFQVLDKTVDTVQNWKMRKAEIKQEMDDLNATALYCSLS